VPPGLPERVQHHTYIPLSLLLPSAAVLVHNGGIGSCAQALRSGVPQLVVPLNLDQPDNAHRLRSLGVADTLPARSYTAKTARTKLEGLLREEAGGAAAQRARELAPHLETAEPPLTAAATTLLSRLLPRQGLHHLDP